MNDIQKLAFINTQIGHLHCEIAAMQVENMERIREGSAPAYGYDQFMQLIDKYGLDAKDALPFLAGDE